MVGVRLLSTVTASAEDRATVSYDSMVSTALVAVSRSMVLMIDVTCTLPPCTMMVMSPSDTPGRMAAILVLYAGALKSLTVPATVAAKVTVCSYANPGGAGGAGGSGSLLAVVPLPVRTTAAAAPPPPKIKSTATPTIQLQLRCHADALAFTPMESYFGIDFGLSNDGPLEPNTTLTVSISCSIN